MDNKDNLFNEMNDPFEDIFKIFEKKEDEEKKVDENSSPKKEDVKSDIDEHPIFKNKEALEELRRKEEAKLRPGEDPFDAAFRIFDPEGKRKVEMPKPAPNRSEYNVPNYDDTIDLHKEDSDVAIELNTNVIGDSKKAVEFFEDKKDNFSSNEYYKRIKNNSVGKGSSNKKNGFFKGKIQMNPVLKGLIIASVVVGIVFGAKTEVDRIDNKRDLNTFARYSVEMLNPYSHYNYNLVSSSESDEMIKHIEAAIEFYDNMGGYNPQYRGLSIYKTYMSVAANNRLQVMDGFLDNLKLKNSKNDSIMIQMASYDCFLEYALSVVENYEDKEISKYDKVIEEYKAIRAAHPDYHTFEYLSEESKEKVNKLMEEYRNCNNEMFIEFMKMEKSGGHRR